MDKSTLVSPTGSILPVAKTKQRFTLILLTAIYALAFVDRQIVNILAEPIKDDLGLADWQLGVLAGPAFALFYTLGGVPLARLAERWNRVYILSAIVTVWSAFTALSGLATNFIQLLIARIGVGTAESGCVPSAHSLISDITPQKQRATALAVFSMGLPIGSLLGLAAGGIIAEHFNWRSAFFLVGIPGVVLAMVLLFFVREPRSMGGLKKPQAKSTSVSETASADVPSLKVVLKELWAMRSFVWMTVGASILAMAGYGHATFYASFFLRNHAAELNILAVETNMGGPLAFLGLTLGLAIGISGALGTALGGRVADRLAARRFRDYMVVPIVATAIGTPLTLGALIVPSVPAALGLFALAALLKSMWYGPIFATIHSLVASRSRATAVSVFLMIMNGIGLGLGPVVLGGLSDFLARLMGSDEALRWAMVSTTGLVFFSAACFTMAWRNLPDKPIS